MRRGLIAILIVYWIALVAGTHWPQMPQIGPQGFDKVLHISAYAGLAVLVTLCVRWNRTGGWRQYLIIFVGLAVFGGLDELTQPPFHRTADWFDWFADLGGITLGLIVSMPVGWCLRRLLPLGPIEPENQSSRQ